MPGAGSSAGENEYQPENTGYAGRVPYFLAGLPLGEETRGAEEAIEAVTAPHGEGEANMDERH